VSADRLRTFISRAFEAARLRADDAHILGELIAEADLRGTDTHGVFRLPLYVRRIKAGGINVRPNIRIVEERASTALVDGDNAMGHYKGYALSLIIGLLAGTLNQAAFGRDIVDFLKHPDAATNTGQSILAVRVDAFCPVEVFKRNVDIAVRTIRESQRLSGVERVWLPGEQSHTRRNERLRHGIPIPSALQNNLDELARELGVDPIFSNGAPAAEFRR